jgi:hypothetical protein
LQIGEKILGEYWGKHYFEINFPLPGKSISAGRNYYNGEHLLRDTGKKARCLENGSKIQINPML